MKLFKIAVFLLAIVSITTAVYAQRFEDSKLEVLDFNTEQKEIYSDIVEVGVAADKAFLYRYGFGNESSNVFVYDNNELISLFDDDPDVEISYLGANDEGIFVIKDGYLQFINGDDYASLDLLQMPQNGTRAFAAKDNFALWVGNDGTFYYSDGSTSGTVLLHTFSDFRDEINLNFKVGDVYFFKMEGRVWRSDGTAAGTFRISDGNIIGNANSGLVEWNAKVYFSNNVDIFVTDGTLTGTENMTSSLPNLLSISHLTSCKDGLLFFAETLEYGEELWVSDGTASGTQLLVDIVAGDSSLFDVFEREDVRVSGGSIVFIVQNFREDGELWVSNGTVSGTKMVKEFQLNGSISPVYINPGHSTNDGKHFFTTDDRQGEIILWVHDPQNQKVTQLADLPENYSEVYTGDSKLFFHYRDGGDRLWASDGTISGTHELTIVPHLQAKGIFGDLFYFTEDFHSSANTEPMVSDGTINGTKLLKDINNTSSNPEQFFEFNDRVFFIALDNKYKQSLFSTDGTTSGTKFEVDIYTDTKSSNIEWLDVGAGKLYFNLDDTLWLSTGSTAQSHSLGIRSTHYYNRKVAEIGKHTIFHSLLDSKFWSTDGTVFGTNEIFKGFNNYFDNFLKKDKLLWIFNSEGYHDLELYKTDGTPNGTTIALESIAGRESLFGSSNSKMQELNGMIYFVNSPKGTEDEELWRSDGSLDGTVKLTRVSDYRWISGLFEHENEMYFSGLTSTEGSLLKIKNSTDEITKVADQSISVNSNSVSLDGLLYYVHDFKELWLTDGTADNTKQVYRFNKNISKIKKLGDKILIQLQGYDLFVYDKIQSRTVRLGKVDYFPGWEHEVVISGDLAYFIGVIDSKETIVQTDGTPGGTVSALGNSHRQLSQIEHLKLHRGKLYFIASTPKYGHEIYYFDLGKNPTVSGIVYDDANKNGFQDANESGIGNYPVIADNGEETLAYTDDNGRFEFYLDNQSYTVYPLSHKCWTLSSDSASYHLSNGEETSASLDFGLAADNDEISSYSVISTARTRCGFTIPAWVDVKNDGCDDISGRLELTLDELIEFVEAVPAPSEIKGNTIIWEFQNISRSTYEKFKMSLLMPSVDHLGETVKIVSRTFLEDNGMLMLADSTVYTSVINCAYDPNDKLVSPDRSHLSSENYTRFDEELTYTIRFQNTGTDTAFTVRITDKLSPMLDIETFEPLTASHSFVTNVYPDRTVEFVFRNILLPDSSTNQKASNGYVIFRIQMAEDLEEFSNLENTARIYFDFNEAIVTNTMVSTLVSTFDADNDGYPVWFDCDDNNPDVNPSKEEILGNNIDENCDGSLFEIGKILENVILYPNPTNDVLSFDLGSVSLELQLVLRNSQGQILMKKQINSNSTLSLDKLASGMYFVELIDTASGERKTKKIVKMAR